MMGAIGARSWPWPRRSRSSPTSCATPTPPSSTSAPRSMTSTPWSRPQSPPRRSSARSWRACAPPIADAVPTIRDLDQIVRRPGAGQRPRRAHPRPGRPRRARRSAPARPTAAAAISPTPTNGAGDDDFSQGAFGESVCALAQRQPDPGDVPPLHAGAGRLVRRLLPPGHDRRARRRRPHRHLLQPVHPLGRRPPRPRPARSTPPTRRPGGTVQHDLDDKCPGAEERPLPADLGDGGNVFTDGGTIDCDPGDVLDEP